ncbi:hypothetical protein OG285_31620 [Streptomyces sp. NBC_01471]|uniref:hypothetical protein n=1 Tax=Streptomyces sp. NBC_01471 TaxID=2903879 RepID=UPI00324FFA82
MMYAWCFDHGTLHRFLAQDDPWCTAAWVPFTAASEDQALIAKQCAYGDARFFNELPGDKQLEVIEIRETWASTPGPLLDRGTT